MTENTRICDRSEKHRLHKICVNTARIGPQIHLCVGTVGWFAAGTADSIRKKLILVNKARNGLSKVRKWDHTGLALRRQYIRVICDQGVLVGINAQ